MNQEGTTSRRRILVWGAGIAGSTLTGLPLATLHAAALLPTPRQTTGPFYPERLPLDSDNDLVGVGGRDQAAAGQVVHLFGQVQDMTGRALAGYRVEIWQCDAAGFYHHSADRGGRADPNFQGYGQMIADDEGRYRFRTIEPVPYPGRTPHIHMAVSGKGIDRPLTTQLYLKDHPLNARDFLFNSLRDEAARDSLLVDFAPAPEIEPDAKAGSFTVVLGLNAGAG